MFDSNDLNSAPPMEEFANHIQITSKMKLNNQIASSVPEPYQQDKLNSTVSINYGKKSMQIHKNDIKLKSVYHKNGGLLEQPVLNYNFYSSGQ